MWVFFCFCFCFCSFVFFVVVFCCCCCCCCCFCLKQMHISKQVWNLAQFKEYDIQILDYRWVSYVQNIVMIKLQAAGLQLYTKFGVYISFSLSLQMCSKSKIIKTREISWMYSKLVIKTVDTLNSRCSAVFIFHFDDIWNINLVYFRHDPFLPVGENLLSPTISNLQCICCSLFYHSR